MSLLNNLTGAGGIDLQALGERFGMSPDQVSAASAALLPKLADPNTDNEQATAQAAEETGVDHSTMRGFASSILAHAQGAGGAGMLGKLTGALDRDGDGNPLNDVMGFFGKK